MRARRSWFIRYLRQSLGNKKIRSLVASFSLAIATAMLVMTLGISIGVPEKLGRELKSYGANVIVGPAGPEFLEEAVTGEIQRLLPGSGISPQLYGRASISGKGNDKSGKAEVEIIGAVITGQEFEGARVMGRLPGAGEALLGADLQEALPGINPGEKLKMRVAGGEPVEVTVAGYLETGGPQDGALVLPIKDAQKMLGAEGRLSAVFLRVPPGEAEKAFEKLTAGLQSANEGVNVKTLRQVASAEVSFLRKIELLMLVFSAVIIFASAVSVSSTAAATVYERMREIALMKSIGGTGAGIRKFYMAEAAIIGALGGVLGYLAGFAGALAVSKKAFGSYIFAPPWLVLVSVAAGVLVSVLAGMVPLASALKIKPSLVLRGE